MSLVIPKNIQRKSDSNLHHMIKVVNDHNHITNIGKDGAVQTKPTHGTRGK